MEKVKLTKDQADAIEDLLKDRTAESIVKEKANPLLGGSDYIYKSNHRWWAKHGRDVWEIKYNDVIYDGIEDEYFDVGFLTVGEHERERYEVVCFVEDRKDV